MSRLCLGSPTCPHPAVTKGRCSEHARQADQGTRGTANARGYTYRWAQYSKARLQQHPWCVLCEQDGRIVAAQCTDHIEPASERPDLFWEPSNHRSLCLSCNTREELRRRKVS